MSATDQIAISVPRDRWKEQSQVIATAKFRDRGTSLPVTPTNVRYRLDCLTTGAVLQDWTAVTTGTSVNLTLTPTNNRIMNNCNPWERKQLSVAADYGLTTQFVESTTYDVTNIRGLQ